MSVPFNQSELFHAALQKADFKSRLHRVEGAGHGFLDAIRDTPESLFEMSAAFFDQHLNPEHNKTK